MRRTIVVVLLLAAASAACPKAQQTEPQIPPQKFAEGRPSATRDPAVVEAVRKTLPAVEEMLRAETDRVGFPSLSVGVVANDELVWRGSFGAAVHTEPVFRLGSITKLFTALAILKLRDEGKIDLDAPAATYLPELGEVVYPTKDSPPITLRHIFTHTSGLPLMAPGMAELHGSNEVALLKSLEGLRLEFAPGSRVMYSNYAVSLAGIVVSRVSNKKFRDYVDEQILGPLWMRETVWEPGTLSARVPPPHVTTSGKAERSDKQIVLGAYEPSGGLYSTIADMGRFMIWQLSVEPPSDREPGGPVSRATVRESQRVAGHSPGGKQTFGIGWVILEDEVLGRVLFHNGSTGDYSASMWLLPERGVGIIAFANAGQSGPLDRVTREALIELARNLPERVPELVGPVDEAIDRLLPFLAAPNADTAKDIFAPSFLAQIPVETVIQTTESLKIGTCKQVTPLIVQSSIEAVVRLTCDGGTFDLYVHVMSAPPHKIDGARIRPVEPETN